MQRKKMTKAAVNNRFLFFIFFLPVLGYAQIRDSSSYQINKTKLRNLSIASGAAYGATMIGLNQLWYQNSNQQSFRFFNDNREWKQVDKLGHFFSTFYFSYGVSRSMQWCNVPKRKSDLIGALTGFAVMVPIEIMDGFSDAYGASAGDLAANAAGSLLYFGQSRLWNEIRIYPKFSFHQTHYASLRPNTLGDGFFSEALKDYNGQKYWLSVDVDKFITFPKWLNIAAGYGAEQMVYAEDHQNIENGFHAYRQYYLALDLDLTAIRTRSKFVKTLIFMANMLRLPAPALEFSREGIRFHGFAF